jgi:hypothetical protein
MRKTTTGDGEGQEGEWVGIVQPPPFSRMGAGRGGGRGGGEERWGGWVGRGGNPNVIRCRHKQQRTTCCRCAKCIVFAVVVIREEPDNTENVCPVLVDLDLRQPT